MLCRDIIKVIENTYPKRVALAWDNVGLLLGRTDKEIQKIYVALEVTESIIDDAIENGADMLITHHPLIFEPLKQITDEHFIGNRVVKLLQHDISCYTMHTNYDVLRMADLSATILGLDSTEVLEATNAEGTEGVGRVGQLSTEITLRECCKLVKERFRLDTVKVFGDLDAKVKKVAISPGSGRHMKEFAIAKEADVFVTGDIDHHEGLDANAQQLAIIDAGHYGLEHIFIDDVAKYLKENLREIEIVKAKPKHPFQVV